MKSTLRLLALAIFLVAIGWWLAAGANRGWTKNSVPVKTLEEVTGIEGVNYQKRFVPGVDFLALAAAASILCAGISSLFRIKRTPQSSNQPATNP